MEKIEKLLAKRDMTAADLTRLTGISSGRLSKLGQQQGKLRLPEALKVAKALGVSVDYLADDEMDVPSPSGLTLDEQVILENARVLGYEEAKRRLLGVPASLDSLLKGQKEIPAGGNASTQGRPKSATG